MRRAVVFLVAACFWVGAPAATGAGPKDALTEDSTTRTETQAATDFADRIVHRCHQKQVGTSLEVTCEKDGSATFVYEFGVPGKAINLRPKVSASDGIGVEGSRNGKKQYDAFVGLYGQGTYTIDSVRLRVAIPTAYDSRPCVTEGEWARISVWLGGFGGTMQDVAAVFDTNGKRIRLSQEVDDFQWQLRAYKRCGSQKTRKVEFHHYAGQAGWYSYWG